MNNETIEDFFGKIKVVIFDRENFKKDNEFIERLLEYIYSRTNEQIFPDFKRMSPVQPELNALQFH